MEICIAFMNDYSIYGFSFSSSTCFGIAPIIVSTCSPFLKTSNAGIDITLNFRAVPVFLSISIFPKTIFPSNVFASSSITGEIILQGMHHSAQQSVTVTGYFFVKSSKSESFTSWGSFGNFVIKSLLIVLYGLIDTLFIKKKVTAKEYFLHDL